MNPNASFIKGAVYGVYEYIGAGYAYTVRWVEQNGYRINGNVRESYIGGILNKNSVEDWLTKIQVPMKR